MSDVIEAIRRHSTQRCGIAAIEDASVRWTFPELLSEIEHMADRLRELNIRSIALAADNGPAWIVCDLACHLAGVTVVPLAPFFSEQQCAHAIRDGQVEAVVFDASGESVLENVPADGRIELTLGLSLLRIRGRHAADNFVPGKISYTSGTTGSPKGVRLSWGAQNRVASSLVEATDSLNLRRHMCALPFAVLLENVAGVYAPLLAGATVVCPPLGSTGVGMSGQVDGARLLHLLAATRADSVIVLPQILDAMVIALQAGAVPLHLRFVAVGGATTPVPLIRKARSLGLPVFEGYGLTECCSAVCMNTPAADCVGSVGRPLPHAQIRIARDGEIFVGGALFDGYTGQDSRGVDELPTGDIGFIDGDGYLHVRGRKRNAFVTSYGRNISPEWLETALCGTSAIAQAFVFGEGRPRAVAVVTRRTDSITPEQIDASIRSANETLPEYARIARWIPSDEAFSVSNGMLTANGRLRRPQIFTHYADRIAACYDRSPGAKTHTSVSEHNMYPLAAHRQPENTL